jgi:hypothetical protein
MPDPKEQGRRQGIGATLLLLTESDSVRAYFLLKQLGLRIANLPETGFTETDLKSLVRCWREVQIRWADPPRVSPAHW